MRALREQQGSTSVTEVVKADVRPVFAERPSEQRLEGSVAKVGGVYESAVLRGEDEAAGLVEGTHPFHLRYLPLKVSSQSLFGHRGESDAAALRSLEIA